MKKSTINKLKLINTEVILYIIFGILTTIINIFLFYIFVIKMKMSTGLGNIIDTIICVLFQYVTNRIWVFKSKNDGREAVKEFFQFIIARGVTAIIDQIFVVVGVNFIVVKFVPSSQQALFRLGVKVLSNILVIILNYIFSNFFVFNKKEQ